MLEKSKNCISVSGLNFDQTIQSFNQIFTKVTTNIDFLTEKLEKDVIPKYNLLSEEIKTLFNEEFATKMSELCANMTNNSDAGTISNASTIGSIQINKNSNIDGPFKPGTREQLSFNDKPKDVNELLGSYSNIPTNNTVKTAPKSDSIPKSGELHHINGGVKGLEGFGENFHNRMAKMDPEDLDY